MSLSKMVLDAAEVLRPVLVKILPAGLLSRVKAKVVNKSTSDLEKVHIEAFEPGANPAGVNLVGSIRSEMGLGQSMRLVADILTETGRDFTINNFVIPPATCDNDTSYDHKITDTMPYNVNLFHVNASEFSILYMNVGKDKWDKHYNIAYWLWELEDFPQEWCSNFNIVDEIWTPADFISNTLRKYTDKPVRTISYSVKAPTDERFDRDYFKLPRDKFLFLFMFDSGSRMERKNPLGIIEAYKKAFPTENSDVGLVVKINELNKSEEDIVYIREALKGYENIYFICETLPKVGVNSLIKCADVYVSLHRAEGFGLVMAESMLVGTPTIATNWSANTEFMNSDVACMVDYKMIELEKDLPPFKKGYKWADADTAQAAEYMVKLYQDKDYYNRIKQAALEHANRHFDIKRQAKIMNDRLNEIMEEK